ncbi:MAG: Hsp70 family protein [Pseudomonadota bacterium]
MAQSTGILGVDFGTSNSAAGFTLEGRSQLVELAPDQQTLPSTFFFDFDTRATLIGTPANEALIEGADGRFMRALKRVLGTPLMHEERQILNERVTFVEVIARYLGHIKSRAEAECGLVFDRALSGRPVVFHGADDPREAQAEADLRACYLAAGFEDVAFMAEPEAAALASDAPDGLGLIVDIGGGTSDFSVFRRDANGVHILLNHGLRIGGTDFDRAINIAKVMPLLGKGSEIGDVFGPGSSTAPNAIFNNLATWEKIPFQYTAQNRRMAAEMARLAREPEKLQRLEACLEHELGHDLAFAVETGKIAANAEGARAVIALDVLERGLSVPITAEDMQNALAEFATALRAGAVETLQRADLEATELEQVIYVGGSSLMRVVSSAMQAEFPACQHSYSNVFTAVADGLAIAAGRG